MNFDWKKTLATVAPTLATALGGPMAGVAVKMAADALGVEADPKSIERVLLGGDPNVLLKLKEVENNFILEMEKLGVQNVQNAREHQQKTQSLMPAALSIVTIVGFFGLLVGQSLGVLNLEDSQFMMMLLGVLLRETAGVYGYWLGSSKGSNDKNELLRNAK